MMKTRVSWKLITSRPIAQLERVAILRDIEKGLKKGVIGKLVMVRAHYANGKVIPANFKRMR